MKKFTKHVVKSRNNKNATNVHEDFISSNRMKLGEVLDLANVQHNEKRLHDWETTVTL
jgi:hypothetical protein